MVKKHHVLKCLKNHKTSIQYKHISHPLKQQDIFKQTIRLYIWKEADEANIIFRSEMYSCEMK